MNSKPVDCAPPVEVAETLNVTLEPGVVLPELTASETCWAFRGFVVKAMPRRINSKARPFIIKCEGRESESDRVILQSLLILKSRHECPYRPQREAFETVTR